MQKPSKHIVIIAGEESGDMHAAALIQGLTGTEQTIKISGIGGKHMAAAGAELLFDLAQHGVTGLTEVLRHFKTIRAAFNKIKAYLKDNRPDLLILVDYPGFNLRLAKYAKKKLNLKILYYISPQIWAWKPNRIQTIRRYVDRMAVILPFEKALYEKAAVPVNFVGHPLTESLSSIKDAKQSRKILNLPLEAKIIALLPGSRRHEIERHMPILRDTALLLQKKYPNLQFVIPLAETASREQIKAYCPENLRVSILSGKSLDCMNAADFVIVKSGTASLECALLLKPMCIIYKVSWFSYYLATKLIRVKFLGLCNLLSDKMMVPEFLQYDCNPQELFRYLVHLYENVSEGEKMIAKLSALKDSLSSNKSDCSISELIENELSLKSA